MVALREQKFITEELNRLAGNLESLSFGPATAGLAAERDRLTRTLRSYLIPRAVDPSIPLTVVLAGPTGSGKSTLINSLAGLDGSRTGALRPTTRVPVVFVDSTSAGSSGDIGGVPCHVVDADAPILEGMVLVDTPDIDSTSTSHRAIAEALIDNADVVVFVTSALRYSDEVPWQILRRAESRGATVLHVLNRLGSSSAGAIVDFRSRLAAAGLDDDLITVPEHHLPRDAHRLPELAVRSLRKRLQAALASAETSREESFARVLRATISHITSLVRDITNVHDDIDGLEAEVSVSLAGRASNLDVSGLGSGIYPEPPPRASRLAKRRWVKRSEVDEVHMSVVEVEIADRLTALFEEDVRAWLLAERAMLESRRIDTGPVIAGTVAASRAMAEGWTGYVARVAADFDATQVFLGQAVLLDAATAGETRPAVDLLFGSEGQVVTERARRELINRVEMVYETVGDLVVAGLREQHGDLDDEDLRTSLGAVTSALAPAYA